MLSELPDLDEDVSFVVDDGASTGPVPLRLIVASVLSGQRASNVLVWWAGATDWMRFDSHPDLVALLNPVAEQPHESTAAAGAEAPVMTRWGATGGDVVFADDEAEAPVELADSEPQADEATADGPLYVEFVDMPEAEPVDVELIAEVDQPETSTFPDPVVEQFVAADQFVPVEPVVDPQIGDPAVDAEVVVNEAEVVDAEVVTDEVVAAAEVAPDVVAESADHAAIGEEPVLEEPVLEEPVLEEPVVDDVVVEEEAAAEQILEQPVAEVPTEVVVTREVDEPEPAVASEGFSFGLPTREATEQEEEQLGQAALTGLFSSGAREEGGLSGEPKAPSPDALDAIMAARDSLESVGARIEALTSATRRTISPEPNLDGTDVVDHTDDPDGFGDATDERESVLVASVSSMEETPVEHEHVESTSTGGSWRAVEEDAVAAEATVADEVETEPVVETHVVPEPIQSAAHAALNERFQEMVRKSVSHQRRIEWVMRVDELLLSACITAIADSGFVAMDLASRESDHRVLFDHNSDSRQVRLELSPVDTVSDHLGRHVRFGLSWGRDVHDIDVAIETVDREAAEGLVPPGVLTCDADMSSGVVSTHVELILAADDFVKDDYSVDRQSLDASIAATLHALEERWHVLFD